MPDIQGLGEFKGKITHACDYKSGESFRGKKVLVVGCGNSGMELSLDLCIHNASPSIVVRNSVDMEVAKTQENERLQCSLREMQLQFKETKACLEQSVKMQKVESKLCQLY
ncbi:hypothetical protein QN277_012862 [Acacia crassicarpa]|uniref:Flavin-containing monooxygenase n=1 Tax=Acacia crassicarpa TaxID=499986 RepID=A0AAE1N2R6_9FABA|nr:hypothetical protein QN277_012862 [Acacia crassicarpa]